MEVLVPFSADRPKSRLAEFFSPDERESLARSMLDDVLRAVTGAGGDPRLLSTEQLDPPVDHPVTVDSRPLTTAVNAVLAEREPTESDPLAVVMADLALATPPVLGRLFDADGDVVIVPGRGGGTNALVVRTPSFRVDYHGLSYLDHREAAAAVDAEVTVFDSHRLATDIDERADLVELLIHGDGAATDWLREAGVTLDIDEGRVGVGRSDN